MPPPVVLGFLAVLGAAALLVLLLILRTRPAFSRARVPRDRPFPLPEGLKMNDFVRRLLKASGEQNRVPDGATGPTPASTTQSTQESGPTVSEADEGREAADQASIEVGDQVAVILASTKHAAQQLQESARAEAERIRAEAKEEAAARLGDAERKLARRREEDAKLRAEAEAYSRSTREAADHRAAEMRRTVEEELAKRRTGAEQEASEIRRAAKLHADQLTSDAIDRQGALIAEAKRSEARLEQLAGVFRAMTTQLEDLVGERRAEEPTEEEKAPAGEELDEALRPQPAGKDSTWEG